MTATTGGFATLLAPGLWRVAFNAINRHPNAWQAVLNVGNMDQAYIDESEVAGLGGMLTKPEGVATTFDDPIMGSTLRYSPSSYGLGFRVTREMYDDDLYSIMNRMAAELGKAAAYKVEVDAWSVLNNAFTAGYVGIDGLVLGHVSHTRLDGGTVIANKPSTDVDFSFTALQAGLDHFKTLVDNRGRPIDMTPKLVVIDTSFEWAAKEILQTEFKPYTANNEINVLKDEVAYMTTRYLTDADSWFLLTDKGGDQGDGHDLRFFWRVKPETAEADDFLTGDALYKIYARYAKGFAHWRGVYCSSGG
jgi:hypothetical protein